MAVHYRKKGRFNYFDKCYTVVARTELWDRSPGTEFYPSEICCIMWMAAIYCGQAKEFPFQPLHTLKLFLHRISKQSAFKQINKLMSEKVELLNCFNELKKELPNIGVRQAAEQLTVLKSFLHKIIKQEAEILPSSE